MRRLILFTMLFACLVMPVNALEITAPEAPETAQFFLEGRPDNFSDGLLSILRQALPVIAPAFSESVQICAGMVGICLLLSLVGNLSGKTADILNLCSALSIGTVMLRASKSLVTLGVDTVEQISEYGKLLLPVLTAALTAEGGITASSAMYAGTAFFNAVLSAAITKLIIPLIYSYLCLSISACATETHILQKMKDIVKWAMTWILKIILYIFTGYIGISGVVTGSTDAMALKATKLTISGVVPVVGSILADASEAVLVSAGVVKNAAGVYGVLVILALGIGPFIQIGSQYLMLKATEALCAMFSSKNVTGIISDFGTVLGMLAAMTMTVCLMQLISIVCFMRGIG